MKKIIPFIILFLSSCGEKSGAEIETVLLLDEILQRSNITQVETGNTYFNNIKSELAATKDPDQKIKNGKLNYILSKMVELNRATSSIISMIEHYKIQLLESVGENVSEFKANSPDHIIWHEYNDECGPSVMNLRAIISKDILVGENLFINGDTPSIEGIKLWDAINKFRIDVVSAVANYSIIKDQDFSLEIQSINSYKSLEELDSLIAEMIENSNANLKEDKATLFDLYKHCTKPEMIDIDNDSRHWITASFENKSLVECIATLNSMENDILYARAIALRHWSTKAHICGYGFTSILPMVSGPSIVHPGEEIDLTVFMGAFDEYNQPLIEIEEFNGEIFYPGDGTGRVVLTAPSIQTELEISGTISIKNKSGIYKTKEWTKTIMIQ